MDMSDLPEMHAQILKATGLRAEGTHITKIMSAHVTTDM